MSGSKDGNSSPVREMSEEVYRVMNDYEIDADSPFDDSDVDPDFVPENTIPNQLNILTERQSNQYENSPLSDVSNIISRKSRKRKRNVDGWKRSILKQKRNQGDQYSGQRGELHRAKAVQASCGDGCAYKCNINFPAPERKIIHKGFWEPRPKF